MKILLILKPNYTALEHFRQMTPHEYMCELHPEVDVVAQETPDGTIDGLTDEFLKGFQAVQYIRHIDQKGKTKEAVERLHKLGLKVIYDIDDYWNTDKDHTLNASMKANNYEQTCIDAFTNVDWVTTTTPYFADQIKPYNTNVTVLPNCISQTDKQWEKREIKSQRVRFGWVGGVFHKPDFKLLQGCAKKMSLSREFIDEAQLCICGFNTAGMDAFNVNYFKKHRDKIFTQETGEVDLRGKKVKRQFNGGENIPEYVFMEEFLTNNFKLVNHDKAYREYLDLYTPAMEHLGYDKPYRRIWSRDVRSYGEVYNELDVCLVPLRDTKFNACKSELKIIEAGTMGKAVICSNVTPYKEFIVDGENGLIATDWYTEIKYMIENPEHRKEMAEALSETVRVNFSPDKIQEERYQLYKKLVG